MPIGQEPTEEETVIIDSQDSDAIYSSVDRKVYHSTSVANIVTDDWIEDENLIPNTITKTNGTKIGTCTFDLLRDPIEGDGLIDSDGDATRGEAVDILGAGTETTTYINPYYVKVTDKKIIDGSLVEYPVFFGYIEEVSYDVTEGTSTAIALSYAGLLDSVDLYGGYWNTTSMGTGSGTPKFLESVMPVFNPNGKGNMSTTLFQEGDAVFKTIDESLVLKNYNANENEIYKWNALDIIKMIRAFTVTGTTCKFHTKPLYGFVGSIYGNRNQAGFIKYASGVVEKLEASAKVSDYTYFGKSMWEALVELVTSVDTLGITEIIDEDGDVYVYVIDTNPETT